jgi:hypothetical protein
MNIEQGMSILKYPYERVLRKKRLTKYVYDTFNRSAVNLGKIKWLYLCLR